MIGAMSSAKTLVRSNSHAWAAGLTRRLFDTMLLWRTRRPDRGQLAGLDDRTLRDIGITRLDIIYTTRSS